MALRPIVVCGPSGVGKGTLLKRLFAEFPAKFGLSVSHTTRLPRPGETHGKEYLFTTRDELLRDRDAGLFVETAEFSGNMYGTSIAAVRAVAARGQICVLEIDVQGAVSVSKTDLNARFVFIAPPSWPVLEERLRGRGTETDESVQKRLDTAKRELDFQAQSTLFEKVIVNDDLERAYGELKAWIFAE
eukprot:Unigene5913_Nuclearia_a/m.18101 Unigene5913_Nuclearia_a/g.18101  ORF Unigene5913_Nuclearia_a/g.18101 Unigene5913_Nuclearia_a/m.18101 type:complete len:188 (-) Unigene5913_Nuclearia_a:27-590(-)